MRRAVRVAVWVALVGVAAATLVRYGAGGAATLLLGPERATASPSAVMPPGRASRDVGPPLLKSVVVPSTPAHIGGRNPFEFASAPPPAAPSPLSSTSKTPLVDASPSPAPGLETFFTLVGVAETMTADGIVRTAIIAAFGELHMVKVDEHVTMRYRVTKVEATSTELEDLATGAIVRLALR
ncbi:MAG: hypothetical protein U0Q12_25490 [Vicinamibacterales bacterium]